MRSPGRALPTKGSVSRPWVWSVATWRSRRSWGDRKWRQRVSSPPLTSQEVCPNTRILWLCYCKQQKGLCNCDSVTDLEGESFLDYPGELRVDPRALKAWRRRQKRLEGCQVRKSPPAAAAAATGSNDGAKGPGSLRKLGKAKKWSLPTVTRNQENYWLPDSSPETPVFASDLQNHRMMHGRHFKSQIYGDG